MICKVHYDEINEEYYLDLTEELCNQLNWKVGDVLVWKQNEDGSFTIGKQNDA